jgi:hypothetical protein
LEPGNRQAIEELAKLEKYKITQKQAEKKKVIITEMESTKENTPTAPTPTVTKENTPANPPVVKENVTIKESTPVVKETVEPVAKEAAPSNDVPVAKVFKLQIPSEPPTTAYEFESFWNSSKSDLETFYKYFKVTDLRVTS